MAITVLITLTSAGIDSGPFNLYSDVDGYVSAFASGIGRASLLAGYSSAAVPNGTTIIRLVSAGNCTNYLDLAVVATTTTTTTGLTTTTTTFTTSTTTTGIAYNLQVSTPSCRENNCVDNNPCVVEYNIAVDNAPVGSYLTITENAGSNATVYIVNSSPLAGMLEYYEVDNTGTRNFTIFLRDSGGSVLTSITATLSHQAFWQFLDVCLYNYLADEFTCGGCVPIATGVVISSSTVLTSGSYYLDVSGVGNVFLILGATGFTGVTNISGATGPWPNCSGIACV